MHMESQVEEGNRLLLNDEPAKARAVYEQVLESRSCPLDVAAALDHNTAVALEMEGRFREALELYSRNVNGPRVPLPTKVRSMVGMANCLRHQHSFCRSIDVLCNAAELAPYHVQTHMLLSSAMIRRNHVEEACQAMFIGLVFVKDTMAVETNNFAQCYYEPLNGSVYYMRTGCATSLDVLYCERFKEADILAFHKSRLPQLRFREQPRVVYVSEHFHKGSVMSNVLPLLRNHGTAFGVVSLGNIRDDVHAQVRSLGSLFFDGCLPAGIRFDVAVCCDGHTGRRAALRLLAERNISDVVIDCFGYPFSTGQPAVTHKLVDSLTDPPDAESHYTERLVRLDPCFLTWQPLIDDPSPMDRIRAYAPDEHAHRVLAPNNFKKLSKTCVRLYRKLLQSNENISLFFKSVSHEAAQFQDFFEEGFSEFGGRVALLSAPDDTSEHYDLTASYDVVVDAFPYNGTITTLESMWCGVPVVSLAGHSHRARVGASILSAVGMPENLTRDCQSFCTAVNRLLEMKSARQHELVHRALTASCIMQHEQYARRFVDALSAL